MFSVDKFLGKLGGGNSTTIIEGSQLHVGMTDPTPAQGNNGDSFINKATKVLFAPKTSGQWPNGIDLSGTEMIFGTTDPKDSDGSDGAVYFNETTKTLFGPKSNGSWGSGASMKGDTGPAGPQGPIGETGTKGDKGEQGLQGLQGKEGPQGTSGLKGDKGDQGIQGVKGDAGPAGPQGLKGDAGPQGAQGLKGDAGATGTQGVQGPTGAKGEKGDAGPTGPQGPAGTNATLLNMEIISGTVGTAGQPVTVAFAKKYSSAPFVLPYPVWSGQQIVEGVATNITATNCSVVLMQSRGTLLLSGGPFENAAAGQTFRFFVIGPAG